MTRKTTDTTRTVRSSAKDRSTDLKVAKETVTGAKRQTTKTVNNVTQSSTTKTITSSVANRKDVGQGVSRTVTKAVDDSKDVATKTTSKITTSVSNATSTAQSTAKSVTTQAKSPVTSTVKHAASSTVNVASRDTKSGVTTSTPRADARSQTSAGKTTKVAAPMTSQGHASLDAASVDASSDSSKRLHGLMSNLESLASAGEQVTGAQILGLQLENQAQDASAFVGSHQTEQGSLPFTGADVLRAITIALALIVVGLAFNVAGLRRRAVVPIPAAAIIAGSIRNAG